MKSRRYKLVQSLCFVIGLLVLSQQAILAEEVSSDPGLQKQSAEELRSVIKKLSEVRAKVNADPSIAELRSKAQEAQKAYMQAFDAAMAKEDPTLFEHYKKLREGVLERAQNRQSPKTNMPNSDPLARLMEGDKRRLDSAREKAMNSSVVVEARKKLDDAKTAEDRQQAAKDYEEALHKAMIQEDRSVEMLLKRSKHIRH